MSPSNITSAELCPAGAPVYLRVPELSDTDEFLAAVVSSERLHRPWVFPPNTPDAFAAYVERNRQSDFEGLLVCTSNDHRIAGVINISQIFHGNFLSAYLGYYAMAGHEQQGLMTAAMKIAINFAFGSIGLHRLEANIQPENIASKNLVKTLGFKQEGFSPRYLRINGHWCDHERWALLAD